MGSLTNPCKTPGLKIRSKGTGKGLARGRGRGTIGIPFLAKRGMSPLRGFRGLVNPFKK